MHNIKVALCIGPGQHGVMLMNALKSLFNVHYISCMWPKLLLTLTDKQIKKHIRYYSAIVYIFSVLCSSLPIIKKYHYERYFACLLYDIIVRNYYTESSMLVGFSQVSLLTFKKAKKLGSLVILEHAMTHVDVWMKFIENEGKKHGVNPHQINSKFPNNLIIRMKHEYDIADYIVVHSSFARQSFYDCGINKDKIIQLPLGIDVSQFKPAKKVKSDKFIILYAGRLELLKGVQYLLKAFSELDSPNIELWLVGHVFSEIKPILEKYKSNNIKMFGNVTQDQLIEFYQRASALVFPSINDAFGLVILEGMSCGLPVIASSNSASTDIILDGVDGLIVPPQDSEMIKLKLQYLINNPKICYQIGKRARSKIVNNYTLEHYKQSVEKALLSIYEKSK